MKRGQSVEKEKQQRENRLIIIGKPSAYVL